MALTADTRISSAAPSGAAQGVAPPSAAQSPFDRHGMWLWYVDRSEGGDVGRIVVRAQRAGIGTLYIRAGDGGDIRAGDGGDVWPQFNKPLLRALHQGGLTVCAWRFVYGDSPVDEAKVGAAAARRGADCLVIDAEGQYAAVRSFQASVGLIVDGAIGTMIWRSLLNFDPVRPPWAGRRAKRGDGATANRALPPRRPLSASLPAKANEIDPGPAP